MVEFEWWQFSLRINVEHSRLRYMEKLLFIEHYKNKGTKVLELQSSTEFNPQECQLQEVLGVFLIHLFPNIIHLVSWLKNSCDRKIGRNLVLCVSKRNVAMKVFSLFIIPIIMGNEKWWPSKSYNYKFFNEPFRISLLKMQISIQLLHSVMQTCEVILNV